MQPKYFLVIFLVLALIGFASAETIYTTQGMGETDKGESGVLVPLGIPASYMYLYTWISLGFLALIAASASQRNGEFWAILLPLFASMFVWFGWLVMPTAQGIGIIIMCGVLAFAVYMKGKQQEKFGIAGPGGPFLNIVFWMIVTQASVGFVNALGLFSGASNASTTPLQYQNVDLVSTVPNAMSTGGLFTGLTASLYFAGECAIAAMVLTGKVLMTIVYFKGFVLGLAPFLAESAAVDQFLTVMTVAIDVVILFAIWNWYFKPPVGETP